MINLNQTINERQNKINEIEKDIENLNKLLRAKKDEWCEARDNFNIINTYREYAKHSNRAKRFEWVFDEYKRYTSGKDIIIQKWNYDGIEYRFTVTIKPRPELKVWKYEVHVDVQELTVNKAYYHDNSYSPQKGNTYYKDVKGYGDDVVTKHKTEGDALKQVLSWQDLFESRYKERVDYAKDLYSQACKKYDNVIRIETKWDNRKAFYDIIKYYPDITIIGTESEYIELTGENVKEVIHELNNKYKLKLGVIAG